MMSSSTLPLVILFPFSSKSGAPLPGQLIAFREALKSEWGRSMQFEILSLMAPERVVNRPAAAELGVIRQQHGNPHCTSVLVDPSVFEFIQVVPNLPMPPSCCVPIHFVKDTNELCSWDVDKKRVEALLQRSNSVAIEIPAEAAAGAGGDVRQRQPHSSIVVLAALDRVLTVVNFFYWLLATLPLAAIASIIVWFQRKTSMLHRPYERAV